MTETQLRILMQLAKKVRWLELNGQLFDQLDETDELIDQIAFEMWQD